MPTLNGLVLTGGKSTRMQEDKSLLTYRGKPQRDYLFELLSTFCEAAFISCNAEQARNASHQLPFIEDCFTVKGPSCGILSAFKRKPDVAWLVVACDLPFLTATTIAYLIAHRNPSKAATAFFNAEETFAEPLITIWEPESYFLLLQALSNGTNCPRKVLLNANVETLTAPDVTELKNVNTKEEREGITIGSHQ